VLFCWWCRALLPHLDESAILEHFTWLCRAVSLVLGDRDFSLSSDLVLAFAWLLITCLSFSFVYFLFLFSLNWLLCVCCQCTHQRGDWASERPRTGGWSLPGVMSDWQRGVDWLLVEYCRCRLRLDSCWCRWRAGAKGLSLAGPPRSGETSGLSSMELVAEQGQVRAAWWQEKQDEVIDSIRCRVVAHDQSLHVGFVVVHHKTVGLLGWATKPRPKARRAETGSGSVEKLRCQRTRGGIAGLASGEHGLRQRRGRLMKRSATWSSKNLNVA
jgi:hypothetical protein